jgi:hypothetical protein
VASGDDECELVPVDIRVRVRLAWPVDERQRERLRTAERVVGERQAEIEIGRVVPRPELAEELPDAARVVKRITVIVRDVRRREDVAALGGAPVLELERAAAERAGG